MDPDEHVLDMLLLNSVSTESSTIVHSSGSDTMDTWVHAYLMFQAINHSPSDWTEVFRIIETKAASFSDFTQPERGHLEQNILQHACSTENEAEATEIVSRILSIAKRYNCTTSELEEFVNYRTPGGKTALHIAISKRDKKVVKHLIQNGADIHSSLSEDGMDTISLIYDLIHKVMVDLFDEGFIVHKDDFDPANELLWEIRCDFKPITGRKFASDLDNFELRETRNLSTLLRHSKVKRSDIMLHPLVQIFLHLKGEKFKWLIALSVIYHVLWSALSVIFIVHHTQLRHYSTFSMGANESCQDYQMPHYITSYTIKLSLYISAGILYILTIIKETVELISCPSRTFYWKQYENVGQWILLVVFGVAAVVPMYINASTEASWPKTIASVIYIIGIVTALLLIQGQSTKLESVGIYNQMLIKSMTRFIYFFLAFSPILLTFMFTFFILLNQKPEFGMDYGLGLAKILAMVTGELNYDGVFHPVIPYCLPHPIGTKIVFLFFIVGVVILLQNLLVGLTVEDVTKLKDECKTNHLAARLEVIFLIENFLTCQLIMQIFRFFTGNAEGMIKRLCVGPASIRNEKVVKGNDRIKMDDLPKQLQNLIKTKYS